MRDKRNRDLPADPNRRWSTWLGPIVILALVVAGGFFGLYWLLVWIGEPASGQGASNLVSVLEAQAAMTAIFLAAMIFTVEAVQRREGLDDPLYELFLTKSWARWIFATAVWLLVGTALVYLFGPVTDRIGIFAHNGGDVLGIISLILAAVLLLAFLLRALDLLRPERYREFREEALLAQVSLGARSSTTAGGSTREFLRQLSGELSDKEAQATRAIERVADQTSRAASGSQLSDLREGMALMEEICRTILFELERAEDNGIGAYTPNEQRRFGHDNILVGMQRIVNAALNADAPESVLRAVFHTDVDRMRTAISNSYRLVANVENGNELFVQIMLDCMEQEKPAVQRLAPFPHAFHAQAPWIDMLSDALTAALSKGSDNSTNVRRRRIAKRIVVFVHKAASSSAFEQQRDEAAELLACLLPLAESALLPSERPADTDHSLETVLRRASVSAVGYGVAIGSDSLPDRASAKVWRREIPDESAADDICRSIREDVELGYEGETRLFGGLLGLTVGMRGQPLEPKTELEVNQAAGECVVLGYMWLLGMIYGCAGEPTLPEEARDEFDRVWQDYGESLASAYYRAGLGRKRDLLDWGGRVFKES